KGPGRIHRSEDAHARLREIERVRVMRKQRRQRREEHRVDEDDRADEDEQAAHGLAPAGGSLLEEGAKSLLALFSGTEVGGDARRCFTGRTLANQLLRCAYSPRARGQQIPHDAFGGGIEIVCDLVDETDSKGGLGVEALTGEEVAPCMLADLRQ